MDLPHRFLLISNDADLVSKLRRASEGLCDQITVVHGPEEALPSLQTARYRAVFFQLEEGEKEDMVFCRQLRRASDTPIVLVMPGTNHDHLVRGFTLGADACLDPRADEREMTARVEALLRRTQPSA